MTTPTAHVESRPSPDDDETPDTEPFDKDLWDKGVLWCSWPSRWCRASTCCSRTPGTGTSSQDPCSRSDVAPASGRRPVASAAARRDRAVDGRRVGHVDADRRGRIPHGVVRCPDIVRADFAKGAPWPARGGLAGHCRRLVAAGRRGQAVRPRVSRRSRRGRLARALASLGRAKVGLRVRFAARRSGSVAITAWAHLDPGRHRGRAAPHRDASGRHPRLLAARSSSIARGTSAIASGTYEASGWSASFELIRRGERLRGRGLGRRGHVGRRPADRLARGAVGVVGAEGDEASMKPAAIEAIWAG